MLSPQEAAAREWGMDFKRIIRAAAAMHEIYDDKALARAVQVSRGTVGDWWDGARPGPGTIPGLARATGLSTSELYAFIHDDGPAPGLPNESRVAVSVREGVRRDQDAQVPAVPDTPSPSAEPRPRGSAGGRA